MKPTHERSGSLRAFGQKAKQRMVRLTSTPTVQPSRRDGWIN